MTPTTPIPPICGAIPSAGRSTFNCMHLQGGLHCGAEAGSCQHQQEPAPRPTLLGMQPVSTSGYLRTMPANVIAPRVPAGGLDLEDDTPLAGGACGLGRPEGCDSCQ